jgi:hypothetical protein
MLYNHRILNAGTLANIDAVNITLTTFNIKTEPREISTYKFWFILKFKIEN